METLGNNPWKPLGTIHGNFHGTLIKLSWNFDQGSMKVLSKFRESFIQGFPWIIPKGFHGFYPGFHGLLSRVSMGFPQGFPRILTWMVPTNSHVETYRGTALSNTWEHMGTTGNLWKPTVGTDHLFVGYVSLRMRAPGGSIERFDNRLYNDSWTSPLEGIAPGLTNGYPLV